MTEHVTVRTRKIKKNHRKNKLIAFSVLAAILMIVVIFARKFCPYDPNAQLFASLEAPTAAHIAGTDRMGRDMLSRILMGLQTSVLSSLALVAVITAFGTIVGVIAGYVGGVFDAFIMRVSDICLAFPGLVFALAIAALLNGGLVNAVIALAVVSWPKYARLVRSRTLAIKSIDYISAAKLAGDSTFQIILRHILPNIMGQVLVTSTLDIGTMMMELAGLSFLGLGAVPPTAELGNMMSSGRSMIQTYPWVIIGPGIAILIAVAVFNLFGDALRDYLDPRN